MAGKTTGESHQSNFLTEDIVINILLRLPIASCIFRFRCVCRSWRNLLSDPQFVQKILFFQAPPDQKSLQILIAGAQDKIPVRRIRYSLHSYDSLCPTSVNAAAVGDLPSVPYKMRELNQWTAFRLTIVGCCDGVFCISDMNYGGASDIILWNPTTSETKFLPLSPCPHPPNLRACWEYTGFGFDPLTRDYKVVRTLRFERNQDEYDYDANDHDDDPEKFDSHPPFTYKEVYSLRNDSWKSLSDNYDFMRGVPRYVHPDPSQGERCYWSYSTDDGNFGIISFDMGKEVFEVMTVAAPFDELYRHYWSPDSCFVMKESFVTTFNLVDFEDITQFEIWGLMKYGANESWTKLFAFQSPIWTFNHSLEVWKDGRYICSQKTGSSYNDQKVFILDPTKEEIINDCLEIQDRTNQFQVHTFTPTQFSLSD